MKICVFGLWNLGTVTAAALAKLGHEVIGLDFDEEIIRNLNNAIAPVSEPELDELIRKNIDTKLLSFTNNPKKGLNNAEVLWITFDTPIDEEDRADISFIERNFDLIAPYINNEMKIIISSQVPIGFTKNLQSRFFSKKLEKKAYFSYSPENLRLGNALNIFLNPDRIIIGINSKEKEQFFPIFSTISDRLEWMSIESAEMTKHAINAFLATSICFANEVASLCEYTGANAKEVERGLKTEERIGQKAYLNPGGAFSGGTLAREIRFLMNIGKNNHIPLYLINSVLNSNEFHKNWIKRKCTETMGKLNEKKFTILGLTYKSGTNTLRRSLAVELGRWLSEQGAIVTAYDPSVQIISQDLQNIISLSPDIISSIKKADCVIITKDLPDFKKINREIIITNLQGKIIIDPNGFIESALQNSNELKYFAVGRSKYDIIRT